MAEDGSWEPGSDSSWDWGPDSDAEMVTGPRRPTQQRWTCCKGDNKRAMKYEKPNVFSTDI